MTHQHSYIKVGHFVYSEKDIVGKGSFGRVYRGKKVSNGESCAIKVMNIDPNKQNTLLTMIKNEVNSLTKVKQENIVQFYDCIIVKNTAYVITEFCNQKDLKAYLKKHKVLEEHKAVHILKEILLAFQELCKQKIVHRDLKPANILLHNGKIKIADFGFAKHINGQINDYSSNNQMNSRVGTPLYMSPQILEKQKYTTKSDIWSIGIIFYEMLFGKVPWIWVEKDPSNYLQNIKANFISIDRKINNISKGAEIFLMQCLKINEEERIGWDELFIHSLVKQNHAKTSSNENHVNKKKDFESKFNKHTSESQMRKYQRKTVNPSQLIGIYQDKIFNASKEILQSQHISNNNELIKTTIDQKLKNMNRLLSQSSLKTPSLHVLPLTAKSVLSNISYEEGKDPANGGIKEGLITKSNLDFNIVDAGSMKPSSPGQSKLEKLRSNSLLDRLNLMEKKITGVTLQVPNSLDPANIGNEMKRIENYIINRRNFVIFLNDILMNMAENNETLYDEKIMKNKLQFVISKLIDVILTTLYQQLFTKRLRINSKYLENFYDMDLYHKLISIVDNDQLYFKDLYKSSFRAIFDIDMISDKDKDEIIEYINEINQCREEIYLIEEFISISNDNLSYIRIQIDERMKMNKECDINLRFLKTLETNLNLIINESIIEIYQQNKLEKLFSEVR